MKQIIVDNFVTNYYITEDGKCFSDKTNKFLKGQISNSGYLNYNLTLPDGSKKRYYAHRLVALHYLENKNNLDQVNHIDGNKLNNNVNNLEWTTAAENQLHRCYTLDKGEKTKVYKFDSNKNLIAVYESIGEAEKNNNISRSMICQEIHKEPKTLSGGFYWNDNESNNFDVIKYANTGKAKTVLQYDLNHNLLNTFSSCREAADAVGGNNSHIGECCRGKIKTYKNYIWEYLL